MLISNSRQGLKDSLNMVDEEGAKYDLKINPKKSKRMTYDYLVIDVDEELIDRDINLKRVEEFKYLGKIFIT